MKPNLARPFRVPRWILHLITINLFLWLCLLPLVYFMRFERMDYAQTIAVGMLWIPVILLGLLALRLLIYLWYATFWYVLGCISILGVIVVATAVGVLIVDPHLFPLDPASLPPPIFLDLPGAGTLTLCGVGAFVLFITLTLLRRLKPLTQLVQQPRDAIESTSAAGTN